MAIAAQIHFNAGARLLTLSAFVAALWIGTGREAAAGGTGWFTGQAPDLVLSAPGPIDAGGALNFNHPGGLSTDGTRLVMSDRVNNRVLIWDRLPAAANTPPDRVLGQSDFRRNDPGEGLGQFNFPGQVSIGGGRLVVADSNNNRVLVWLSLPSSNAQPADFALTGSDIIWPWGAWTDGTKLIVSSTQGSKVLIWNTFPTSASEPPSLRLLAKSPSDGQNKFGTPRQVASDGRTFLVVGDHNAKERNPSGGFFWNVFPTADNQPYSFFGSPVDKNQFPGAGGLTATGKFVLFTPPAISIWNSFPTAANVEAPDLVVGGSGSNSAIRFDGGDGGNLAIGPGDALYIAPYNDNRLMVYPTLPTSASALPSWVIGAPDIATVPTQSLPIVTNAVPATDCQRLIVSSDFDRKIRVWNSIPTAHGTPPDYTYSYDGTPPFSPWDSDWYGATFLAAGRNELRIWNTPPGSGGNAHDLSLTQTGSVSFKELRGVAYDGRYSYLGDYGAGMVYVYSGLPAASSPPLFTFSKTKPGRLASDGTYLAVTADDGNAELGVYRISALGTASALAGTIRTVNGKPLWTTDVLLKNGQLWLADQQQHKVYGWASIDAALSGAAPDTVLGEDTTHGKPSLIGFARPGALAMCNDRLWVGEFKFGNRLLGFKAGAVSPQSGWYWNATEPGRGFFVEVTGGKAFLAGFHYAADGRATWFTATGSVSGNAVTAPMQAFRNGQTLTGTYRAPINDTSPGNLTLRFTAAASAALNWPGGNLVLNRFSFGTGGAGLPETGWWWNSAESGRGFAIETQGDQAFIAGFMYDEAGNPAWLISTARQTAGTNTYTGRWQTYRNGQAPAGPYRNPSADTPDSGSMTLQFNSATTATLTLPDGRALPLTRYRF